MPIAYKGNVTWQQSGQTEWQSESWGYERATVPFRGAATLRKAFEDSLTKWQSMPGYSLMRLESWQSSDTSPVFPTVQLNYIGLKGNTLPPVKITNSVAVQTAQGQGVDDTTDATVTGSFVYRASRTTYTWFTADQPPVTSPYTSTVNSSNPLSNIISYHIENADTGKPANSIPYSAFVTVFNSLIVRDVVSNYEYEEIVPGILWACRADVDLAIVQ